MKGLPKLDRSPEISWFQCPIWHYCTFALVSVRLCSIFIHKFKMYRLKNSKANLKFTVTIQQLSQHQRNFKFPANPIRFIQAYFNVAYVLFACPIRIRYDSSTGFLYPESTRFRKVVFKVLTFFMLVAGTTRFIRAMMSKRVENSDPLSYFQTFERAGGLVYTATAWTTMCHKLCTMGQILDVLQHQRHGLSHVFAAVPRKIDMKIAALVLVQFTVTFSTFILNEVSANKWELGLTYRQWCDNYYQQFFLYIIFPKEGTFQYIIKAICGLLGFICVVLTIPMRSFIDWLPLTLTVVLYDLVAKCGKQVKKRVQGLAVGQLGALDLGGKSSSSSHNNSVMVTGKMRTHEVVTCYRSTKLLSKLINQTISHCVFGLTLTRVPSFIFNVLSMFHSPVLFVRYGFRFLNLFSFVSAAAMLNNKAIFIESLLDEPEFISNIPKCDLSILLYQISRRPIGIYCGEFFKITSGFLGSIISLILTFSVVILQFQASKSQAEVTQVFMDCSSLLANQTTTMTGIGISA